MLFAPLISRSNLPGLRKRAGTLGHGTQQRFAQTILFKAGKKKEGESERNLP